MRGLLLLGVGLFFISGCLVRTYTIYKPRKNIEITGNQGYIVGEPSDKEKKLRLGKMRPITVIEVELGEHPPKATITPDSKAVSQVKEQKEKQSQEESRIVNRSTIEEEITREEIPVKFIVSESLHPQQPQKQYKYYTVQKNDTLQKISYKFYGTTRKWKLIYEENKDVIKDPDYVYPGTKIKIPF